MKAYKIFNHDWTCKGFQYEVGKTYKIPGKEWKKTPVTQAKEIQIKEAWEGMPKEAINYLKSLPEFDANIFEKITGIKVK